VKRILLFIAALLFVNNCFAQDIVERKNRLTDFVTERFQTVIQTKKQIKQGVYHAFYDKKIVIASGGYVNDKKIGTWHFFDPDGKLLENFNYDTNKLLYEAPEYTTSNIRYNIDYNVTDTDKITKPIRPGGRYFGYVPYLRVFKLPTEFENANLERYDVLLELLVSPLGRLADYKMHFRYANNDKDLMTIDINPDLINAEDKIFIPASYNGQTVSSIIMIKCYITKFNGIDM
jgi:hypothetical protein